MRARVPERLVGPLRSCAGTMKLPLAEVLKNVLPGAVGPCGLLPCSNASTIECQGGCSKRHAWANALGPVTQCPAALTDKFGCGNTTRWCDNGKYTCGLRELAEGKPCVVVSIGSSNQWDFESDIFTRTTCRIIVLDCTCPDCVVPAAILARTSFHPVCLDKRDADLERATLHRPGGVPSQGNATVAKLLRTWPSIVSQYVSGVAPTYLKMDIEGAEVAALEQILSGPTRSAPHLIGFEMHQRALLRPTDGHRTPLSQAVLAAMGRQLRNRGYEFLSRDDNRLCPFCTELLIGRIHEDIRKENAHHRDLSKGSLPSFAQRSAGYEMHGGLTQDEPQAGTGHSYASKHGAAGDAGETATKRSRKASDSLEAPATAGNLDLEHRAFLNRCGPWCDRYIALHNGITQGKMPPRYLEIDCSTSLCGGWGNILQVVGAWTFLAYLTDRAAVVRLSPSIEVHRWATSPFFRTTTPPSPDRYGQNSTHLLASFSEERNVSFHLKAGFGPMLTQQLAIADLNALLTHLPVVTARPDTTVIIPSLLKNPWTRAKLQRDHFPHWLGAGVGMENMVGRRKSNDSIVDMFAYMHFHPTCRLWTVLSPYLHELGFPSRTYHACHVRSGDKAMVNSSGAHRILYQALDFNCLGEAVGRKPFFFAADTRAMVESAHRRFGSQLVITDGVPTHLLNHHVQSHADAVQLDPGFEGGTYKTFADFYMLAFSGLPVIRNSHRTSFSQQAGGWGRMRAVVLQNSSQSMSNRLAVPATQCCAASRCWAH